MGQPVVSGDLGLPTLPLTQTGSFQPRSFMFPTEPPSSCRLCPSQTFPVCVWQGRGEGIASHFESSISLGLLIRIWPELLP